jgi:hypothetical protein
MNTHARKLATVALLVSVAAIVTTGCAATRADITSIRDAWLGASYDDVVLRWGAPVRSVPFGDGRVAHTWFSESVTTRGTLRPSIGVSAGSGSGVGIGIGFGTGGSQEIYGTCERVLTFRDGRVVDQSWFGPANICATFRRN